MSSKTPGRVWQARKKGKARKEAETKMFERNVVEVADLILEGTFVSIDPSIGSLRSMPGYAVFKKAELQSWGTVEVDNCAPWNLRLESVNSAFREIAKDSDLLVVEYLRLRKLSVQLFWAVGAALASSDKCRLLELPVRDWKPLASQADWYKKDDACDARIIGETAIFHARRLTK